MMIGRRWSSRFASLEALRAQVGNDLGFSKYIDIDQNRVNGFADSTNDWQWIHTNPERAQREGPFGGPVAHGFLSLSLIVPFLNDAVGFVGDASTMVNIGLNRVRFISPVLVGDRLRGRFKLLSLEDTKNGAQAVYQVECWTESNSEKPAVIAESVIRYLRDAN